jgi:hypothetical protein
VTEAAKDGTPKGCNARLPRNKAERPPAISGLGKSASGFSVYAFALAVLLSGLSAAKCHSQAPPADFPPGLQDVIKLTKAAVADDIICTQIRTAGVSYQLSADTIVYLQNQGVSKTVIATLMEQRPNPAAAAAPPVETPPQTAPPAGEAPPPPPGAQPAREPNFQYFHDQLAPFGAWIELAGAGACWKPGPDVTGASPEWRPYYDNGKWVETENGLFWQSDYVWGDIPFHYGRWLLSPAEGWVWVPDYTWGPAWVFWRHAEQDGAIGWAALPPGAVLEVGGDGFLFNGVHVGLDFEFGLGVDCFTFVEFGHFHERFFRLRGREFRYHVGLDRRRGFYGRSVVRNEFHRDAQGRMVNNGIGRDRMSRATRVDRAAMEERHPVGNREAAAKSAGGKPGGGGAPAPSKVYRPPATAGGGKKK